MTQHGTSLYVSTACLRGIGYQETLNRYREAGIDRVELGYCSSPEVDIDAVGDRYPFEFIAHNYFRPVPDEFNLNLASPDESIRDRSIEYVRDSIDFCHRHGIELYTFHAGFRVDPNDSFEFSTKSVPPSEAAMTRFVDSLRELLPYASDRDVEIAIENNVVEPNHVVSDESVVLLAEPTEFIDLFDRIDIGVLLDTGHLNVAANTMGFERETLLEVVGPRVDAVHLHSNDGTKDAHDPVKRPSWAESIWRRFDVPTTVEAHFGGVEPILDHLSLLATE